MSHDRTGTPSHGPGWDGSVQARRLAPGKRALTSRIRGERAPDSTSQSEPAVPDLAGQQRSSPERGQSIGPGFGSPLPPIGQDQFVGRGSDEPSRVAPESEVGAPGQGASGAGARFLRDLVHVRDVSLDAAIPATVEYRHYLRPDLVWQWGAKVTAEEALLACKLIVEALRGGRPVKWQVEARRFLNQSRAQLRSTIASEAAGPDESVVQDDGSVCSLEDLAEECVEEREPVDEEPETEVDRDATRHDPGFPDLNELLDEARELAEDLEGQGEREDSFARELLRLVDENKKLIIGLGLLLGAYTLGARYLGSRLVFKWAWNAVGAEFERRLARSLQLTGQVEQGLRRLEQVKATLQELDGQGGAGISWKTTRERWSKRAVAQLDDMACGPACVKMIMEDHGLDPIAQEAIIRAVRGDSAFLATSAESLARFLNSVDPRGGWAGGTHSETWPDVGDNMLNMARRLSDGGSWIAKLVSP